jgi:hypothetical protein
VTIAARECASYQDITANLARNNIMESLQDLGAATLYLAGEPIDPRKELEGQPSCRPISGWRFTAGSGYRSRAVSGVWGSLSIVTDPDPGEIITEASTPLLGFHGEPIAGRVVRGATTIELGRAAAERAGRNDLWLQGGTPADPMLFGEPQFTGKYGFGALRCAIDNVDGDNVETIQFPAGVTHVFCYAYYVAPPPSSGTIVIRKETRGAPGGATEAFEFGGNLSYDAGGAFHLSAADGSPGSATFYRAETRPGEARWSVHEEVPDGWKLTEIDCTANGSAVTKNLSDANVDIDLAAGDTVTCTYVDRLTPPKGALLIRKTSEGGVGSFRFEVVEPNGDVVRRTKVKTTREGIAASSKPLELDPGRYRVLEHAPTDRNGEWRPVSAACDGEEAAGDSPTVTIAADTGAVCSFVNRLAYPGRIAIDKETIDGTGTAAFTISPLLDPSTQRHQVAVVHAPRTPVRARGDSTRDLPFGTYVIQEAVGQSQNPDAWSLVATICNRRLVPFEQGRIRVRITAEEPRVNCRFVDLFAPGIAEPDSPVDPPVPGGPEPNLTIEKQLVGQTEGAVPVMTFRLTVSNHSAFTVAGVAATDSPGRGMRIVSEQPSQGTCVQLEQLVCELGAIPPGGQAIVLVEAESPSGAPTVNRAVLGSSSPEASVSDDRASVQVDPPRPHSGQANSNGHPVRTHPSACSSALPPSASRC